MASGAVTRIIPQDSDLALFFWDAYENMEQVIDHLMLRRNQKCWIRICYLNFKRIT